KRLTWRHEGAQLRFLYGGEKTHAGKLVHGDQEPAGSLRHRLNQQHAGHQRMTREMALEDRGRCRDGRLSADRAVVKLEFDNPVDEEEVVEAHANSIYAGAAPFAAISSSMRAQRFSSTKYCSVAALPSLTSCVHCSSGSLMPNALSIANATSRKSRLSMPRSSMAWLSGVIFSRSISHVSEMRLATVSKVEDIGNPLKIRLFLVGAPVRA